MKPMRATHEKLYKAIKAGKLRVNKRNAAAVRDAYCWAVLWDQGLKDLGLDDLPDPDGISEYPQVFENWLVKAFAGNFESEEETRAAFHKLRALVIKDGLP